ncbi:lytic transglycosylase [Moraxella caviae]|uniref:Lytic transglycosylase n=1 Tax=Moraxella caviae TaxID=34060 RepID=A0A1S9ZZR5_9GAMM|nr:lytic murein transglycosylase [Moraxella caviae]OOR89005.1 lytic transglycosylase [Moraxella caviae]STZ14759.1 Membrane-bound lytic murein transglycosylase B precursor [Moraxella caviae]VEW13985.1 Membrane-bound lytic murein transglycosylase B precursor [Moraxella caviae]
MKSKYFSVSALALATSALLLAACSSAPTQQPIKVTQGASVVSKEQTPTRIVTSTQSTQVAKPTQTQPAQTQAPAVQSTTSSAQFYASFDDWKSDFIRRAIASGYNSGAVYSLMNGAALSQRVIDLDRSQAEFSKMPWEYVEGAASSNRINQGRSKLNDQRSVLVDTENRYGVPKEITTAIWGMESSFGAGMGNMDLVNALSSLAYDGRRRDFAESQLLAMLSMIERGDVSQSQLKGSWAGGMGHTQFIPATWIQEGVDGNGDGRKNPWTASDALTSTASYLGNAGWVRGVAPYYEVRLPQGFDYRLIGEKRSLDEWRQLGLTSAAGEYFSGTTSAELWLPAGISGPVLLATQNFDVIKVYNNSSNYALGVALLAKRIAGGQGFVASWPTYESPLSRTQVQALQRNLTAKGYNTGGVDGIAGANTRRAFASWQQANGKIPDGFISQSTAGDLIW